MPRGPEFGGGPEEESELTYYDILGIAKNASPDEVRAAWRQHARHQHPDANPANHRAATKRFQHLSEAYHTLIDPEKRQAYDLKIWRPGQTVYRPPEPPPPPPPPPPPTEQETSPEPPVEERTEGQDFEDDPDWYEDQMRYEEEQRARDYEIEINPRELRTLKDGVRVLGDLLNQIPNEEMPQMIIFPDASARPYYYAVKPVIEYVCQQKGVQAPVYRYVKTPTKYWLEEMESEHERYRHRNRRDPIDSAESEGSYKYYRGLVQAEIGAFAQRMTEVFRDHLPADFNKKILVVDDIIRREYTLDNFEWGLKFFGPGVEMKFFAFVAKKQPEKPNVTVGTISGDKQDWFKTRDYMDESEGKPREQELTGVRRGWLSDRYVEREGSPRPPTGYIQARRILRQIGKEYVDQLRRGEAVFQPPQSVINPDSSEG